MSKKHDVMALVLDGALRGYLTPRLAQDANLNLGLITKGVTAGNFQEQKQAIRDRLVAATTGKLAQDADLSDVIEMLDALDDNKQQVAEAIADDLPDAGSPESGPAALDEDPEAPPSPPAAEEEVDDTVFTRLMEFLKSKLSSEDLAQVNSILDDGDDDGEEAPAPPVGDNNPMSTITKPAMDAAIAAAVRAAESRITAKQRAIREAERAVAPYVGVIDTLAMDSAAQVYRLALDAAKVDLTGVPEEAFPALVKMLPRPGVKVNGGSPQAVAMDSAADESFNKRYGNVSHLKRR